VAQWLRGKCSVSAGIAEHRAGRSETAEGAHTHGSRESPTSVVRHDEGQDLIEYALLVGLISLVAVAAITLAGGSVNTIFTNIQTALANAA